MHVKFIGDYMLFCTRLCWLESSMCTFSEHHRGLSLLAREVTLLGSQVRARPDNASQLPCSQEMSKHQWQRFSYIYGPEYRLLYGENVWKASCDHKEHTSHVRMKHWGTVSWLSSLAKSFQHQRDQHLLAPPPLSLPQSVTKSGNNGVSITTVTTTDYD